jgi:hypothetical protein
MKCLGIMAVVYLAIGAPFAFGQTTSASSASSSTAASSPASGMSMESQAISYQAISDIAGEIAARSAATIAQDPSSGCKSKKILLLDPNSVAQINAHSAFTSEIAAITDEFDAIAGVKPHPVPRFAFPDTTNAVVGALTAIKASQEHAEFTSTADQIALTAQLLRQLQGYELVTAAVPSLEGNGMKGLNDLIQKAYESREKVSAATQKLAPFKAVDKQFSDLLASLYASSNGAPFLSAVLGGQSILRSLDADASSVEENTGTKCGQFHTLTLQIDAAGGGTRQNHIFWVDLFRSLAPSYNGGAVVTYVLATRDGKFLDGDVLRRVYNYSKWNADKVPAPSNLNRATPDKH